MTKNEKKFYDSLEEIFTGAKIEGEGGFINLLHIKSKYYKKILEKFQAEINANLIITNDFKEDFFDTLYSFFSRYFSESGSVYYVKSSAWQKIYEKMYTSNKDVILFWKTNMLYYVKSDILYNSIDVTIKDNNEDEKRFYFDVTKLKNKANNEKKELAFIFDKIENNKNFLKVDYSTQGSKTKIDEIARLTTIDEETVEKAVKIFRKQSSVDYFINKNARAFLTEQLDLYLHQKMLDNNQFNQEQLNQLKTVKDFAIKIIDFVSQFEDELVRIWNKPKFVKNSNYVISLDTINDELKNKIAKSKGLTEQINEWKLLKIVKEDFDFNKRDKNQEKLPIDTKYFKELELEIINQFENLDESLNGRLIHSENYQALNTIKNKYQGQVQCVYIDPPFNTGKDFAYIDGFQDSTWCTLMDNRFKSIKNILNNKGSFFLHLDENANYLGRLLFNDFGFDETKEITFHTMAATDEEASTFGMKNVSSKNFVQESQTIFYGRYEKSVFRKLWKPNRRTSELNVGSMDLIANLKPGGSAKAKAGYDFVVEKYENDELVEIDIPGAKTETIYTMGDIWSDILSMSQSTIRQHGENISFQGQKPEHLLRRIVQSSTNKNDLVLDYFAGTGTTAAVAHKLSRKWLTIEQGLHFHETYIDINNDGLEEVKIGCIGRLKIVLNGDKNFYVTNSQYRRGSTLSKDINWQGGGFFKYYELEQYEDTLRKMKYNETATLFDNDKPFESYVFATDTKLASVLEKKDSVNIDFSKLYENIDFAETIANLMGKDIVKITKTGVLLEGDNKEIRTDYNNMNNDEKVEFIKLMKNLLWWGE